MHFWIRMHFHILLHFMVTYKICILWIKKISSNFHSRFNLFKWKIYTIAIFPGTRQSMYNKNYKEKKVSHFFCIWIIFNSFSNVNLIQWTIHCSLLSAHIRIHCPLALLSVWRQSTCTLKWNQNKQSIQLKLHPKRNKIIMRDHGETVRSWRYNQFVAFKQNSFRCNRLLNFFYIIIYKDVVTKYGVDIGWSLWCTTSNNMSLNTLEYTK